MCENWQGLAHLMRPGKQMYFDWLFQDSRLFYNIVNIVV